MTVPGKSINHHVKKERDEMFTRAWKTTLDLVRMRESLQLRKDELMAQLEAGGSL
ncbi:hypothetical protein [Polaromonas sp.]|uniref:hypothetical protein n=1 Tax=Polaromonas sp. TaxID=1869339 RepID=UPI0017A9D030|nr:hypothetical protein [Polaromonas sp.]NML84544.1 hypothetical protein [Polaromonas sp.]